MTAQHTGAYAKVNGLEMYYEVHGAARGDGRPLVLLHGGVLTIDLTFAALLPALAEDRQVIAVELQGHGHTADIGRPITIAQLAEDVVALLDELGVDRADVFGFSLGGLTALQMAVAHPGRVGRLVLASTHYRQDGYYDEITDPALQGASVRLPTQADFQEMSDAYARTNPDPGHFQEFLGKCTIAATTHQGWTDDDLRAVSAPTLMVIGDTDFVRIEHAAQMLRLIAGSHLAVLPATTHMLVVRRPALLLPMLDTFLNAAPGA